MADRFDRIAVKMMSAHVRQHGGKVSPDLVADLAEALRCEVEAERRDCADTWAIGNGLSPDEAQDFAQHIRYGTDLG